MTASTCHAEGSPLPEIDAKPAFRSVRILIHGTERALQLGTLASVNGGDRETAKRMFDPDTRQPMEFPSFAVANVVCSKLEHILNAPTRALHMPPAWILTVAPAVHEQTETWAAMHRFDRTALETAYFLADVLPAWVKK